MDRSYIYIFHILIVGPLFIYTGYLGDNLSTGKNKNYKNYFWMLIALGIGIMLYHSFLLLKIKKYIIKNK